MKTATLHPQRRQPRFRRTSAATRGQIEEAPDLDTPTPHLKPASYSYLEPQGEGILFATFCLLSSLIIYSGVLLIRFLS
jgi:hypothetical protein